ncbi:uncharacterized protein LOC124809870 isoform X2 [Hydra vulgaris]|uniref:uncharacterized protein LOC124809870 isoform X2 n=1 Tax=Hydra vulgaris TaxID=6087 RepID=UPI0032EA0F33
MLSKGGEISESCDYEKDYSCVYKDSKIKDLDIFQKELDLDLIQKEVENKELKLAQLEERIKLMAAKKELEKSALPETTSSDVEPKVEVPPALLPLEKELTWNDFMAWRRTHLGPKTRRAFHFWIGNGGRDLPTFTWRRVNAGARRGGSSHPFWPSTGQKGWLTLNSPHRGNSGFVINNYSYS